MWMWKKLMKKEEPEPEPRERRPRSPDGMLKKSSYFEMPKTSPVAKFGSVQLIKGKFYAAVTRKGHKIPAGFITRVEDPQPPLNPMRLLQGHRIYLPFFSHVKKIKERTTWVDWETYQTVTVPRLKGVRRMAMSADSQLFEESFTITTVDHAKYDRVGRFGATSADAATVMTLDINTELFPCQIGETLHCVLASSLALDGTKDDGKGWRDAGRHVGGTEPTLADMFDYVCHGKIYKFEDGDDGHTIKVYISFGGLLMAIEGPYKKLTSLRVDYVYLLVKK